MTFRTTLPLLLASCLAACPANAQITDRPRPDGWDKLVFGGRFMDRFLPMPPHGKPSSDTWGADPVVPRDVHNGIEDPAWSYWGGNTLQGKDGKFHLYVCRWAESAERGHMEWPNSHVVHAVADRMDGPYKMQGVIGPGHNPEAFQLADGRFVVYVINGYYISDHPDGPWTKGKFEFNPRDRRIIEGLSNLTFAKREDGTHLMVCRGGGVWLGKTGLSPWNQVTQERVYPPVQGNFEDPVVWRTDVQYHLVVNDWRGRIAYHLRSKNGIHWKVDSGEAYLPGIAKNQGGNLEDWFKFERMKVLQDEHGRARQANFAVLDVLKQDDKGGDNHSSKMICIPLAPGRLLTILEPSEITGDTARIHLKIAAEPGFDPHRDVDVDSLRFGAPEQVDFGMGCKPLKSERSGKDLIVVFDAKGHGFTEDNFAAKLLGKNQQGGLLFGYSRLPWVDYLEPALSARKPVVTAGGDGFDVAVEVSNFGQVASTPVEMKVTGSGKELARATVPALRPFETTVVKTKSTGGFKTGAKTKLTVVIDPDAKQPDCFETTVTPE